MTELTELEKRATETIIEQTDEQLEFTAKQFTDSTDEFDVVEYFVVPQNLICFPVKKDFFVLSILMEIEYRSSSK